MATIIKLEDIKSIVKNIDVVEAMKQGFMQYSNGNTVVPPVGELLFEDPPGDTHIKYGYIKNDDFYVIKIASGFYNNSKIGIASSQGMMLVFNQKTGQPIAILLDEGYLTDIRTAAAGALAAKYFGPKKVSAIGVIGTGIQAKLQLEFLLESKLSNTIWIWGRDQNNAQKLKNKFDSDLNINIAESPKEVADNCNLIVTTTPSNKALLKSENIRLGTHITAVGSDTSEKQELEGELLKKADIIVADSLPQSKSRGEIYKAIKGGFIKENDVVELGVALQNIALQRSNDQQITVVDLTGVAVQDIMIATAVFEAYKTKNKN